jgi:predicted transcriptional regulator
MLTDDLIRATFSSDEELKSTLLHAIKELGFSVTKFAEISGVSSSTLYKIISGEREPNLKTLREILKAIRRLEGASKKGDLIAVVAARPVLDKITERSMVIEGKEILIREYPATSIEEALIAAIHAERDGALALVCAPIVSPTVEKILRIPVASIMPQNSLVEAIKLAARKIS